MSRVFLPLFACVVMVAGACSSGGSSKGTGASAQPPGGADVVELWPLPPDPMARAVAAGLQPETAERLQYHVHAHLDVFKDGKHVLVPGGIGIDIKNPAVHSDLTGNYPAYGGIRVPCDKPCISPLHTHDASGTLHTESATRKNNTFGQLLIEWNVTLPPDAVVYVRGKKYTGDYKAIPLSDGQEIAVVIGTPPADIPSRFNF